MHPDDGLAIASAPPRVRGGVDIAQGVYGQRGNLELIAPAADDGFVVLWFNGDDDEPPSGVARRSWSAGVSVPTGSRLDDARIAQVPFGPSFLEVVLRTGERLERWIWRPDPGFVPMGSPGASTARPSSPVALGDEVHLLVAEGERVLHRVASTERYPELAFRTLGELSVGAPVRGLDLVVTASALTATVLAGDRAFEAGWRQDGWQPLRTLPGAWRSLCGPVAPGPLIGIDARGMVVDDGRPAGTGGAAAVDALAATTSTLDGGTIEVVARCSDRLLHGRRPVGGPDPVHLEPIVPRVQG